MDIKTLKLHRLFKKIEALVEDAYDSGYADAIDHCNPDVGMGLPPPGVKIQLRKLEELKQEYLK